VPLSRGLDVVFGRTKDLLPCVSTCSLFQDLRKHSVSISSRHTRYISACSRCRWGWRSSAGRLASSACTRNKETSCAQSTPVPCTTHTTLLYRRNSTRTASLIGMVAAGEARDSWAFHSASASSLNNGGTHISHPRELCVRILRGNRQDFGPSGHRVFPIGAVTTLSIASQHDAQYVLNLWRTFAYVRSLEAVFKPRCVDILLVPRVTRSTHQDTAPRGCVACMSFVVPGLVEQKEGFAHHDSVVDEE
jgi:hypothetical protein